MKNTNEGCPDIIQALLVLKASGGDAGCVDTLLSQIGRDGELLENAERLSRDYPYPEPGIKCSRLRGDVELTRFLSPNALMIMIAMCQNMRHGNLIQASYRDLAAVTRISSLKAIGPALRELEEQGCITVRIKGTTRFPAVYMVNPGIATVGEQIPGLEDRFRKCVRENAADGGSPGSYALENWEALAGETTYSTKEASFGEDSHKVFFNRIIR